MHAEDLARSLRPGSRRRIPLVLQVELSDCGQACLAMVMGAFGAPRSLASLRAQLGGVQRGMNLTHILQAAGKLGLDARPLRVELEALREVSTPAILHWNLNHFVVLVHAGRKGIRVHDPAMGEMAYSWAEASECFTGIVIEFAPGPGLATTARERAPGLRDVIGPLRGLRPALVHTLVLAIALESTALLLPLYVRMVFDQAIPAGATSILYALAAAAAVLVVLHGVFAGLRSWTVSWIGAVARTQWSQHVLSHLMRLPASFFQSRSLGDLTSRLGSTEVIQQTLSRQFLESLIDGFATLVLLALLLASNAPLALLMVATVSVVTALRWAVTRRMRRVVNQALIAGAEVTTGMIESLRTINTLKLNNLTESRLRTLWQRLVRRNKIELRQRVLENFQDQTSNVVMGLLRVAIVAVAAGQVIGGHGSIGALVAFLAYADLFATRASAVFDRCTDFAMLQTHVERLAEITGRAPEDVEGTPGMTPANAGIEIRSLCFRYSDQDPWVLDRFDLHIRDGESVALVGPSGCGKSTLARLLTGLLDPAAGEILVGGVSIRDLGKRNLRDLIAYVQQDDELFAGTIAQNIALFDPEADALRIREAAAAAQIDAEIHAMPMRYETLCGDMGSNLSGGQKQRVLLARALYRVPKILVLDEATSHLHVACEKSVSAAIARLGITRLIIAHRPETIASADRVVAFGASVPCAPAAFAATALHSH